MANETVSVRLAARDQASQVVGRVNRQMKGLGSSILNLKGLLGGFAAAFSVRAILRGAVDVVQAFGQQQDAVEELRAALRVTGKEGDEALTILTARAAELQRVTRHGDEATIKATASFAQLADALNPQELARAEEAIIGIADTFTKGDLNAAALLLGKSVASSTNALTRYGIQVDVSASQSERLAQVLEQTGRYFEVSKARAQTTMGAIAQLGNAWGDLKEAIGKGIAEDTGLRELTQQATRAVQDLSALMTAGYIREAFRRAGRILGAAFAAGYLHVLLTMQEELFKAILPDKVADILLRYTPLALGRVAATAIAGQFEAVMQRELKELSLRALFANPPVVPSLTAEDYARKGFTIPPSPAERTLAGFTPGAPQLDRSGDVGAAQAAADLFRTLSEGQLILEGLAVAAAAVNRVQADLVERHRAAAAAAQYLRDAMQEATASMVQSTIANLGYLLEAIVAGTDQMARVVINAISNIVQTIISELRQIAIARAAASAASAASTGSGIAGAAAAGASGGFLAGPWGALIGAGIAVVGSVAAAALTHREQVQPVQIERYSPQALNQLRESQGPLQVINQLISPSTGELLDTIAYELDLRTRLGKRTYVPMGTSFGRP